MTLDELEKRLQVLEDLEAIKKLKAKYGQICDDNYNPTEIVRLFTEAAVWDGGEIADIYRGTEEIKKFFTQMSRLVTFSAHYFLPVDIAVEGDKAHGQWYLLQAATAHGQRAVWVAGVEDDEYMKIDGKWLISSIKFSKLFFLTPYEEGWAKKRKMEV